MAAAATSARTDALQSLHTGMAAITSARSLPEVLEAVADGAARWLEFGVACVNLAGDDGSFQAVAVAGSEEARRALLGRRYRREEFEAEFARAEAWGRLLFVPHDRVTPDEEDPGWVPRLRVVDDPDSWHPLDALFAPMQGSSGELVGVLSVDLPRGGRRPDATQCDMLEIYATHAGLTIERVRLADELQQERDRLRASDEAFRLAFHGAAVGMSILSLSGGDLGRIRAVNSALCRMLGRSADEVIGQPLTLITHPDDVARDLQAITDAVAGRIDVYRTEKRYLRPDGSLVWATVSESAIRDTEGRAMYAVALIEDSTDRRSATLALEHRATHDALTGLSNRSALEQHLGSLIVAAERRTVRAALVFCDLDRFKEINDRHGHAVGDHILRHVGARLLSQARSGDLVARLGGDEFVVVAEGVSDTEAEAFAQRIRFALTGPVTVGELTLEVQVSVGVTTFGGEGTPTELLAAADAAMYAAKRAREGTGPAAEPSDDPQLGQRG